ncbi:WD40 repeat-like protein [Pholiota conissans]|uniref:WD40 repeat-like protein n=1 Tax=Pholiota conissans TaxID=109636 RepID=A0A9P5Z9N5_9AGAR|nr:WD40 repeat-like protein [Pholiota conissans]
MATEDNNECAFETPVAQRSRKRVYGSVTNLRSHSKRRRLSAPAFDLGGNGNDFDASVDMPRSAGATTDRFIANRPKRFLPLNATPRTNRIAKQFGLVDDHVLNFKDDIQLSSNADDTTMALLRRSASSLFNIPPQIKPASVTENLKKNRQCLMVLDSPGIAYDLEAFPISWSDQNLIAVGCVRSVFYQNLETKQVFRLCVTNDPGHLGVIAWGHEHHNNHMATGMSTGHLHVWEAANQVATYGTALHSWRAAKDTGVKSLSWNRDVLSVGMEDGEISLIDIRQPEIVTKLVKHRQPVLGLEWSPDGTHLASGDANGIVHIWDSRNTEKPLTKLRHKGTTRALSWCPWKPDLLATGSYAPEGKIRIWSTTSLSSHIPEPLHTISVNNSVLSLQWSPHCKELLSTHGRSFMPLPPTPPRRRAISLSGVKAKSPPNPATAKLTYTQTAFTNAIAVHEYPSGKCLMTLTNAHTDAVTQCCLGPSGENIFTVCPKEETIKMWKVWGKQPPAPKPESAFDRFTIR